VLFGAASCRACQPIVPLRCASVAADPRCLPGPPCLCCCRAAGRGLNLQSSDTVVIYDPDPNPKNEEQAIAR
jgi:hypothetical protein